MKRIAFCILGLCTVAFNPALASDVIKLSDGSSVYVFYKSEIPASFQKETCERYGFKDDKFAAVGNGLYSSDEDKFLIEDNCLFPFIGQSETADGKAVYFFSDSDFNENGNIVYTENEGKFSRAANGKYKLKNGEEFSVSDTAGHISDYGSFDTESGKILYEDRD